MRSVLFFILLIMSDAAVAQTSGSTDNHTIQLIEDIYAGRPLTTLEGRPALTVLERAEISRLSGCDPSTELHSEALVLIMDWNCSQNPDDSRTITVYLSNERVFDLLVQPVAANFRPTERANLDRNLPSRREITRSFLRALRAGIDPTLEGLIPITESQLSRLEIAQGTRAREMSGSDRTSQVHLWLEATTELGMPLITDLRYSDDGRPIGVIISHGGRM